MPPRTFVVFDYQSNCRPRDAAEGRVGHPAGLYKGQLLDETQANQPSAKLSQKCKAFSKVQNFLSLDTKNGDDFVAAAINSKLEAIKALKTVLAKCHLSFCFYNKKNDLDLHNIGLVLISPLYITDGQADDKGLVQKNL